MIIIPTIDFESYDENDEATLIGLADQVSGALMDSGFMKIKNLGVSQSQIDSAFEMASWFFARSEVDKSTSAYVSATENFGYQRLGIEHLDPSKPADLKQTFTMRDLLNHDSGDDRWPNVAFRDELTVFYQSCLVGAHKIQRVFSRALDVEHDFFTQYHTGQNVSLRLLYYPSVGVSAIAEGQLGAGEHTDYGMITLLFQKDVAGLEVADKNGQWHTVEPENDAIVINTGDLMERWTNGRFRSTPHRVQPKMGSDDRYSMAMFVDPDSATPISVLESCRDPGEALRFQDISAGDYIQERILASHKS